MVQEADAELDLACDLATASLHARGSHHQGFGDSEASYS